jgi:DNA uptake protein ComE-like DNA-binding protein
MKWNKRAGTAFIIAVVVALVMACVVMITSRPSINTGDESAIYIALVRADGIGEYLAEEIIRQRPYIDWQDLQDRINGVGPVRLRELKLRFNL